MLAGCKADMICPAYQSYFILDKETQKSQFTYFALDSLPRRDIFNTTTDPNGIVAKSSLLAYVGADWVRNREIRTINMEVIYPQISDSILFAGDAMMFAETDVIDTVALDSARMAAQSFRYGADQKFYNWYFRNKLVWKDELNKEEESTSEESADKSQKKGFFSFIKNLFSKKEKDSLENENSEVSEVAPKEKSGIFKKKEKQPKQDKQKKAKFKKGKIDEPVLEEVPAPDQEEDDGEDDF